MSNLKEKIKVIIFGTNTPTGKLFDLILIISIVLSVALVMLDSVAELQQNMVYTFGKWNGHSLSCLQ